MTGLCLAQVEQAASLQAMQQAKVRLAGQLQQTQAERDRYKAETEQGHQQLLTAGQNQQNLQEQIRCPAPATLLYLSHVQPPGCMHTAAWSKMLVSFMLQHCLPGQLDDKTPHPTLGQNQQMVQEQIRCKACAFRQTVLVVKPLLTYHCCLIHN